MNSEPFLSIACLSVFWLSFFAVDAKAQEGNGGPVPDLDNMASEVSKLRSQAGRGDAMANYQLGNSYMKGRGVSLDYSEAAKYLRAAAEQGLPEGEVALAYLYEHGEGVPRTWRRSAT